MRFNCFYYNKESLEFEQINFRPLLWLIPVIIFSLFCRWFFFTPIFEVENFRRQKEKVTILEKTKQLSQQKQYEIQANKYNEDRK